MKQDYPDLLALTDRKPAWYDEHGVPRFAEFHPSLLPSIYARQAVLFEIECQVCRQKFTVAIGRDRLSPPDWKPTRPFESIEDVDYGDPPIHGCGCAGNTMMSDPVRLLAIWDRPPLGEWTAREMPGKSEHNV